MKQPIPRLYWLFFLFLCLTPPSSWSAGVGSEITLTRPPIAQLSRYTKYEVGFQINRQYANPFDPNQINVEAIFEAPSGKKVRMPGYYYQDFPDLQVRLSEKFEGPAGPTCWKIRFTPCEIGQYKGKIIAIDQAGRTEVELPPFRVTPSDAPGFIHCSGGENARTVFDSGRMFMPIGECLWMPRTLTQFEKEFAEYKKYGMNYFRFFTSHDSMFFFEHAGRPAGQYDLFILRKLDDLFDSMSARGIYAMPCLEMFSDFRVTQPYPYWEENPYNSRNGGPCQSVRDFFVNPEAKRLYKNRLRYFVARYGYSPNLFCLQLFAEANYVENYDTEAVRDWHREMADYLHAIDPYGHPVSTSMAAWNSQDKTLFDLPAIDLMLNENYNARDFAGELARDNKGILTKYQKPAFLAEMGITFEYLGVTDATGVHIHNAIWANPLSGGIGVPSFWWTSYIREKKLLPQFKAFANFIKDEDFTGLKPVETQIAQFEPGNIHPDLIIPYPFLDPSGARGPHTITLPNDRFIDHALPNMPHLFHAQTTPDGKPNPEYNPITFLTDFPDDGSMIVCPRWVDGLSTSSVCMQVRVDGNLAKEIRFNGHPTADWKGFLKQSQAVCVPTIINVSKGRHRIVMDNQGTLVLSASVDFANYLQESASNLRVLGLGDETRAYLWVQNRDNTWWRNCRGNKPRMITKAAVGVTGMQNGFYDVEWWDTCQGACIKREQLASDQGRLVLNIENLETDVAFKIKRVVSHAR